MDSSRHKTTKRTYWFPDDVIERFEVLVPPEKRDEVMNQIIKRWLDENFPDDEETKTLKQILAEVKLGLRPICSID